MGLPNCAASKKWSVRGQQGPAIQCMHARTIALGDHRVRGPPILHASCLAHLTLRGAGVHALFIIDWRVAWPRAVGAGGSV